jgi:hypothetical protein
MFRISATSNCFSLKFRQPGESGLRRQLQVALQLATSTLMTAPIFRRAARTGLPRLVFWLNEEPRDCLKVHFAEVNLGVRSLS